MFRGSGSMSEASRDGKQGGTATGAVHSHLPWNCKEIFKTEKINFARVHLVRKAKSTAEL